MMRATALCKWPKAAALRKTDRCLQVAIGNIFVNFANCIRYNVLTERVLTKAPADYRL